jgi:hypothetical protein
MTHRYGWACRGVGQGHGAIAHGCHVGESVTTLCHAEWAGGCRSFSGIPLQQLGVRKAACGNNNGILAAG